MDCKYCRNKVGFWRALFDREFCTFDHRRRFHSKSARKLREYEEKYGQDEAWPVEWHGDVDRAERKRSQPGAPVTIFALGATGVAVLAMLGTPGGVSAKGSAYVSSDSGPFAHSEKSGALRSTIASTLRSYGSVTLRQDFTSGISGFTGRTARVTGWVTDTARPQGSRLHLWSASTTLSNYEVEFLGQLDAGSLGWAFRAPDLHNYYGAKLSVMRSQPSSPNAELVRFVMLDGREHDRTSSPLPLTLERGKDYLVRVSVHGNRFLTSVNGQIVSSWSDSRISRGGIGFFDDSAEKLAWVSLSERDSLVGRIMSHFSLIRFPAAE